MNNATTVSKDRMGNYLPDKLMYPSSGEQISVAKQECILIVTHFRSSHCSNLTISGIEGADRNALSSKVLKQCPHLDGAPEYNLQFVRSVGQCR
jgi:hypothetical protein